MMLRLSFGLTKEADAVEKAVDEVLNQGLRTRDIAWGGPSVSGSAMTKALVDRL
jgi:3-isopropylmalate dehydrogenase